jgi:hypothetical protein
MKNHSFITSMKSKYIIQATQVGKFLQTEARSEAEAFAAAQRLRDEGFEVTLNGKSVSVGERERGR